MRALVISCLAGEASIAKGSRPPHSEPNHGRPRGGWEASELASETDGDPSLWLYRQRTVAMLRRYLRLSVETGRLPSLLGREFFRTRVTRYRLSTFEDAVIFVHDVERSLEKLREVDQQMIARVVLQEYTHAEVARLLHCCRQTVGHMYWDALDRTTEIFLAMGLMERFPSTKGAESCQEADLAENSASI